MSNHSLPPPKFPPSWGPRALFQQSPGRDLGYSVERRAWGSPTHHHQVSIITSLAPPYVITEQPRAGVFID